MIKEIDYDENEDGTIEVLLSFDSVEEYDALKHLLEKIEELEEEDDTFLTTKDLNTTSH